MVIFHFSFDLNNFHYISVDIKHGIEWHYFRYIIVTMFVFSAGISLYLANQNHINFTKLKRRILMLFGASLLVTVGSYSQFPSSWIYFGILHFFLFASIVGLLFLRVPKISFFVGIFIIVGYNYHIINMHWLYLYLQPILHLPIRYTEDLASIVPWFGVFLLGLSFANTRLLNKFFNNNFFNSTNRINKSFALIGRHTLVVYLVHQPIFFGLFLLIKYFL